MPAPKNTFLSLLLLAVPFGVKGNTTTTVILVDIEPALNFGGTSGQVVNKASAIGLDPNSGGTVYAEEIALTGLAESIGVTTTFGSYTKTVIQAASWVYETISFPSGEFGVELNCTLGTNGTTGECIEIDHFRASIGTSTITDTITTYNGPVAPLYTVIVTGPLQAIPTSTTTSSATILGNPTFNRLLTMVSFNVMLIFDF